MAKPGQVPSHIYSDEGAGVTERYDNIKATTKKDKHNTKQIKYRQKLKLQWNLTLLETHNKFVVRQKLNLILLYLNEESW